MFFKSPVAKVIWFAGKWDMRSDHCLIISNEDIINLVLDPFTHLDAHLHWEEAWEEASMCSLHMAFTFTAKNTAYSGVFGSLRN